MTSAAAYGQSITIYVKNAPLENVFKLIEKQSGYLFWCDNDLLKKAKPVDLSLRNASLPQTLDACFKDQALTYVIKGKTIVVKPRNQAIINIPTDNREGINIKGRIIDQDGRPLPGASIKVKGQNFTTLTNNRGEFSFVYLPPGAILQITFVGYESKEVEATDGITVTLIKSNSKLDEVQVIAYGTTTQRLSTGNISTVKAKDIESQPVSNPLAALQGRVSGLVITQGSGVAGSSFKVQIRGQSSIDLSLSQNNPLFIIDGVPFEAGNQATNKISSAANNPTSISTGGLSPLNNINPQDIESIDVLKDADATSIYGSRGANGVIIITTKKGKPGSTQVNINTYSGFSHVGRTMGMLNTQQYVQMRNEALANDGYTASSNVADPGYAPDITLWDTTRYTDFKNLLIGNTGYSNNIQSSVSGGNNLTQFLLGANYHRETTVYPGDFSDNVASVNFNINHRTTNDKFHLLFSGMYSNDKNRMPRYDLTRYINLPPNLQLFDAAGNLNWAEAGVTFYSLNSHINPLSLLEQKYNSRNENLSANLNLNYLVTKNLTIRTNFGYNTFRTDEFTLQPKSSIDPNGGSGLLPSSEFSNSSNQNWIIEPQLEYSLKGSFGKLNVLVGNTLQNKIGITDYQYGTNYTSDLLLGSIGAAGLIRATNDRTEYRYTAFFGRINYNFQDRYILNLSARKDGSSRFGPDRQWANFGALGLAWLFYQEQFIKDNLSFLSYGKIRTSYGTTGNDQIGDYKFLNLWSSTANIYNGLSGLNPRSLYNPEYNWEISKKFEVAIESGFLKDRVFISAAYYFNRSSNQLVSYVLPSQTGFSNVVRNFPGLVQNSGFELVLTTKNFTRADFRWATSINLSIPKNKLIAFPNIETSSYRNSYVVGQSLNIIRGYKYLGVNPQTGVYTFEDYNGDGQLTATGDYQNFGNRDPKFYGGMQNSLSYENLDLSFFFQFTKQTGLNYIAQLGVSPPGQIYNQPDIVLKRWQRPSDVSEIQKFSSGPSVVSGAAGYLALSDGKYTDASFIKLRNVSLSYRFPVKWLQRIHISGLRVYTEAQNFLTITNYKGADPESQDFFVLPPLKTIVAGFQLNL
ncbi:SusC/RagA family TonB-linked outer membrane protein [Pedobacter sp. GR22-10]|uniref:SusC/RagA family TonB-linked outer membrane protein n=1 Tax=Pedobacter sp. GR22-10 TaxID=2994472 RepID=UPI002247B60F|nr:SusC/RagA family TonB-linked outer membrane protein [Pedobacter sp. GR22-10]MCX2429899.1 SusC/RagA family TonB-linked outer membrane protein [Pedobacter sp. GR22-10]